MRKKKRSKGINEREKRKKIKRNSGNKGKRE